VASCLDEADKIRDPVDRVDKGNNEKDDESLDASFDLWTCHGVFDSLEI